MPENITPPRTFFCRINRQIPQRGPLRPNVAREERYRLLNCRQLSRIYHYRHSPKSIYANGKTNACKKCGGFRLEEPLYRTLYKSNGMGLSQRKSSKTLEKIKNATSKELADIAMRR